MQIAQGRMLLHYRLVEIIGKGGMGEVWKAVDTTLDRNVAIKLLPDAFAQDQTRLARFEREAKLLASMNHPNVSTIHGLHEVDGHRFLAMELVAGHDLSSLLSRGALSLSETLSIFSQVAEALEATHENGVIHRDLKPANIRITPRGRVKVLDFGLAKSVESSLADASLSIPAITSDAIQSSDARATITSAPTQEGTVLGTAAYMSPEQARAQPLDARTDIWSFGCVLYEALAGKPAFSADTLPDTLVAVLTTQPDWDALPSDTPDSIDTLLRKCLRKRAHLRLDNMSKAREAIEAAQGGSSSRRSSLSALSLAVLPFANHSTGPRSSYLGDGISGEINNALSHIKGLSVAAPSSCGSFRCKEAVYTEVGAKLGVRNVVEGSIRTDGGNLFVSAQLISIDDGSTLWSDRFERKTDDVFHIADEIASGVIRRLQITSEDQPKTPLVRPSTSNLEAYEKYIKGRHYQERNDLAITKAYSCFNQALAIDYGFAAALAGRADAMATMTIYGLNRPHDSMPDIKTTAQRALELDETLHEAHNALALSAVLYEWNWSQAASIFERAIEINPSYSLARCWYGFYYLFGIKRHVEDAIKQCQRAIELDALNSLAHSMYGMLLTAAGQHEEAIAHLTSWIIQAPNSFMAHRAIGLARLAKHDIPNAITSMVKAISLAPDSHAPMAELGLVYASSGREAEAEMMQKRLLDRSQGRYVPQALLSWIPLALGHWDVAFRHLEQAYEERDGLLTLLHVWPAFKTARKDPLFKALTDRIGL